MRTNVVLNDKLVEDAFRYSETIATKRELLETALQEYIDTRKRNNISDLRGKVMFQSDYDYKAMRN
jgi:hypothetical protein